MIKYIIENHISIVVATTEFVLDNFDNDKIKFFWLRDARSATFYAMGLAQKTSSKVALIINYEDLYNAYSPFFEAWMQHTPIYVMVATNNSIDPLFNRCFSRIYHDYERVNQLDRPILVKFENEIRKNKMNYSFDCKIVDRDSNVNIFYSKNIELINTEYIKSYKMFDNTYGIISRYLGIIEIYSENSILICDYEEFVLDINVLNSRYLKSGFKMIILCRNQFLQIEWVKENNLKICNTSQIEEFIQSDKPSVLIYGEA